MEDKDIVGKKFTVFKFDKFKYTSWYHSDDEYIGTVGVVKNIHDTYPEYANIELRSKKGKISTKHFPTHLVKEQIEKEERENNKTVDDLLIEMKQLISRI